MTKTKHLYIFSDEDDLFIRFVSVNNCSVIETVQAVILNREQFVEFRKESTDQPYVGSYRNAELADVESYREMLK